MASFLMIPGEILLNHGLGATDKLILSYMYQLSKGNKAFFGSMVYLSKALGVDVKIIGSRIKRLQEVNLIEQSPSGLRLAVTIEFLGEWHYNSMSDDILQKMAQQLADGFR